MIGSCGPSTMISIHVPRGRDDCGINNYKFVYSGYFVSNEHKLEIQFYFKYLQYSNLQKTRCESPTNIMCACYSH